MSAPPSERMNEMNGSVVPGLLNSGQASLCDPEGTWLFRQSPLTSLEHNLSEWKRMLTEGGKHNFIWSSPLILPSSLGGWILRALLQGDKPGRVAVTIEVVNIVFNQDATLPLQGRLEITIDDRQAKAEFVLARKDCKTRVLDLDCSGLNTEALPEIKFQFTPLEK